MASQQELACIYSALALQDDGVAITGDKIQTILTAAGITVEPFWLGLYAKALDGVDIKALISNIGSGVGSAPAAAPSAGDVKPDVAAAPEREEKKKEAPKEESEDEDMGFGLFD